MILIVIIVLQLLLVVMSLYMLRITSYSLIWVITASASGIMVLRGILLFMYKGDIPPGTIIGNIVTLTPLLVSLLLVVVFFVFFHMYKSRMKLESTLRQEEKRAKKIFDLADVLVVNYDSEGIITEINNRGCEILGYGKDELVGKNWFDTVQFPENRAPIKSKYARIIKKEIPHDEYYEEIILTKSGKRINITWHSTMVHDNNGRLTGALCSGMDITHTKQIEEHLLTLSTAVEQSPSVVLITDLEGNIEYVNPKFTELTGYEKDEVIGKNPRILKSGHFQDNIYEEMWETITIGGEWRGEFYNKKKNGDLYWEAASISSIKDADGKIKNYLAVKEDITERKNIEDALKKSEEKLKISLEEKNALLRELYHRTKNNMQVVSAMLNLSASKLDDDRVSEVFSDLDNRIQSMSLVHEKLYQSQNLSSINLKEYITDLCSSLIVSYHKTDCDVLFKFDLEDISVLIDAAVPLGLIINELVSNSFKHAFPGREKGGISIKLMTTEDSVVKIEIADNGIGAGSEFSTDKLETIGLQTVFAIGKDQLHGEIELDTSSGFMFSLEFRNDAFETRV